MFDSYLSKRRFQNFKLNKRAYWSLIIFCSLFFISLFSEIIANERPLLVKFQNNYYFPFINFYSEETFGGDFKTEAIYKDKEVQCLIISDGNTECWDYPEEVINKIESNPENFNKSWIIWAPIPYSYNTINDLERAAPSPPDQKHWLGTDDTSRDVLARILYGFRLSVFFAIVVTLISSIIGIAAGAIQGFFGGWIDLIFQRLIEVWGATPSLYIIIIVAAILQMNFWLLVLLLSLFSWTALVGVVRAEFLRARNFEYVKAAKALGVKNMKLMFKHVLPNAMVATLTLMPFILSGSIATLTSLDFLGFGLPPGSPSLGEMVSQGKANLQAPWLGLSAFITLSLQLSLLVFIGEAVRDAFDPRKVI